MLTQNEKWAWVGGVLTVIVGFVQSIAPMIPAPWSAVVIAILGVFSAYHLFQSNTASIGARAVAGMSVR